MFMILAWQLEHVTGNGVKAFIFQDWGMNRKSDSVRTAFSWASFGREIQKDLQSQFGMAEFQKPIFDVG